MIKEIGDALLVGASTLHHIPLQLVDILNGYVRVWNKFIKLLKIYTSRNATLMSYKESIFLPWNTK